ncbi:hypothetical protein T439DRAFT_326739 [Meredithblackwellia eburnea MCA 4105]
MLQLDTLPILPISVATAVVYLTSVHLLRFRRINGIHRQYANDHGLSKSPPLRRAKEDVPPTTAELPMTPYEAQKILLPGLYVEMPFTLTKALEFALFKTYGITTISDILYHTTEFKDSKKAGRRYADTGLLIFGFMHFPVVGPGSGAPAVQGGPSDPRSAICVARINYLHSVWQSRISNDDLLYTLSTFMLEPYVWSSQYEWRPITPLEEMAFFVFFKEIGRRMGIKDIPNEISELQEWAENYESINMVPNERCRDVAEATTKLLLHNAPKFLHSFGEKVVACLLYDRLRESIMVPPPPALLKSFMINSLKVRAFFLRHFALPRPYLFKSSVFPDDKDAPAFPKGYIPVSQPLPLGTLARHSKKKDSSLVGTESDVSDNDGSVDSASTGATSVHDENLYAPKMHPQFYQNEAWYVEEKKGLSWVLQKVLVGVGIWRVDQVPGPNYKPEGFRLETCGPATAETKGEAYVKRVAEEIHGAPLEGPYAVGGCPAMRCPFASAR